MELRKEKEGTRMLLKGGAVLTTSAGNYKVSQYSNDGVLLATMLHQVSMPLMSRAKS